MVGLRVGGTNGSLSHPNMGTMGMVAFLGEYPPGNPRRIPRR
jgi:hypothetical protein